MRSIFPRFSPATARLLVVAALLGWSISLVLFRLYLGRDGLGTGLLWNLFLAALPLLWSSAFQSAVARKRWVWASVAFVLWILFLPNAPYLLTDLIHLRPKPGVPQWYILAMLLSCAATGTLIGYISLLDVHAAIERRFGFTAGWLLALSSLMLCGFGIYLGRFLRWNSWDALTRPMYICAHRHRPIRGRGAAPASDSGHADFRRRFGHRLCGVARVDDARAGRIECCFMIKFEQV